MSPLYSSILSTKRGRVNKGHKLLIYQQVLQNQPKVNFKILWTSLVNCAIQSAGAKQWRLLLSYNSRTVSSIDSLQIIEIKKTWFVFSLLLNICSTHCTEQMAPSHPSWSLTSYARSSPLPDLGLRLTSSHWRRTLRSVSSHAKEKARMNVSVNCTHKDFNKY